MDVDPSKEVESRQFIIYGTSWDMPDLSDMEQPNYSYIATFQMGYLVLHLYEVGD